MYNLGDLGKKIIRGLTILHVASLPCILVVFWIFSYYIVTLWVSHWYSVIDSGPEK